MGLEEDEGEDFSKLALIIQSSTMSLIMKSQNKSEIKVSIGKLIQSSVNLSFITLTDELDSLQSTA